jgi:hypothetical protein
MSGSELTKFENLLYLLSKSLVVMHFTGKIFFLVLTRTRLSQESCQLVDQSAKFGSLCAIFYSLYVEAQAVRSMQYSSLIEIDAKVNTINSDYFLK